MKNNFIQTGLSLAEVKKRLAQFGPNQIYQVQKIKFWAIAKEEIMEPMILLLLVVGFFYTLWGKLEDALTILIVILILVFVEVWNEYRAKKAISALAQITAPETKVLRENKIVPIPTEEIVPGDILILNPGTRINADAKLISAISLQIDESSLTGESLSVEKIIDAEIFAGTLVVSGEGKAKVFATGKNTRLGKITVLTTQIKEPKTPLQLTMKSLAKNLVWLALFFSIAIPVLGILRGFDFKQMLLTGLSLAFAVIPEELPIIITMVLGLGAYKLSQKKFLVKKIKAAEGLGSATVILTDKTGTITQNKMEVVSFFPLNQEKQILQTALNSLTEISLTPTDFAIATKAKQLDLQSALSQIIRERTFGNVSKTRAVIRSDKQKIILYLAGAPEEVLASCEKAEQNNLEKVLESETQKGRRVIAFAQKEITEQEKILPFEKIEKNLNFIGFIALQDPPRPGVKETIATAKKAGIRTIMVTGDHPQTALFIAQTVGIPTADYLTGADLEKLSDQELKEKVEKISVFARTTPQDKYRLVKALQANQEIVAVTGDGINDALALKAANIGIAMGIKGTDAAKEAADIILADDNFVTLTSGIFEGRKFFANLKKGVRYYLSVKVALILIFLLPIILNLPLPFAPIQIIILELFMDLAASAGFVGEPAEKTIYERLSLKIKQEKLLNRNFLASILVSAFSLFLAVSLTYLYAQSQNLPLLQCQTMAFTAWLIGHLLLAFVSRSEKEPLISLKPFSNKLMNLWALAVFAFLILINLLPTLASYFKLSHLNFSQLLLIIVVSFITIFWQEIKKIIFFN